MDYTNFEECYVAASNSMKEAMKKDFIANFPATVADAKTNPTFDCESFFRLVVKREELINKEKFKSLASDIVSKPESGFVLSESAKILWKGCVFTPD